MSSIAEKFVFMFLGFAVCLSVLIVGCKPTPAPPIGKSATDPITTANSIVSDSATSLRGTTATIKAETIEINKITPPSLKPDMDPHTSSILVQATVQDEIAKQLDSVKLQLNEANKRVVKTEQDLVEEHKVRLAAEENVTKEFRHKIMGWSAVCFFGMLLCAALAIFSQGNKLAIYGGIACAIGLAVCVVLVQTIALIPWIVGGIAVLATGIFVYLQFFKDKKIKALSTVTKELTGTIEAQKPLMSPANRQFFFGDGPLPGKVQHIQSAVTQAIVNAIRSEPEFKKATVVPPTDFIDLNNDGIDDSLQTIKVVGDNTIVGDNTNTGSPQFEDTGTRISRKKRFSGVAANTSRSKIILH